MGGRGMAVVSWWGARREEKERRAKRKKILNGLQISAGNRSSPSMKKSQGVLSQIVLGVGWGMMLTASARGVCFSQ